MDGCVFVCHVEVGDGNGAMVIVRWMNDWEGWLEQVDYSIRNIHDFWSE